MRLAALLLTLAALAALPARADVLGRASVTDGDTLAIAGERVRLFGVDAPESRQVCEREGVSYRCGQQAALALADHLGAGNVRCEERDTDRYGRIVAVCYLGDDDVNGWLAREGWAVAYREYARDYVDEEAEAKAARRGLWAGTFQEPADWRRERRRGGSGAAAPTISASDPPPSAGCRIKGNISKGGRIYHAPGTRDYDRVEMNAARGERWFCTEAEARVAGWRPSSD